MHFLKWPGFLVLVLWGWMGNHPVAAEIMTVRWYGPGYEGRRTASGETFSRKGYTAAHANWPFGAEVRVTNPDNGASVVLRINDRVGGDELDVSEQAAIELGIHTEGVAMLDVEVISQEL